MILLTAIIRHTLFTWNRNRDTESAMKKYLILCIMLASVGIVLSAFLLIGHYATEAGGAPSLCGTGCASALPVLSLPLAKIALPAAGILLYLFILIAALSALMAGVLFHPLFVFPIAAVSLIACIADVPLALYLVSHKKLCLLCISTYVVNIALAVTAIISLVRELESMQTSPLCIFSRSPVARQNRVLLFLFCTAVVLLPPAAYSIDRLTHDYYTGQKALEASVIRYSNSFYARSPEKITFPESAMIIGNANAQCKIFVFTDFLCSACGDLYHLEEAVLKEFPGRVCFVHYVYPLERRCNSSVPVSVYKNACSVAGLVIEAGLYGAFTDVMIYHYKILDDSMSDIRKGNLAVYDAIMREIRNNNSTMASKLEAEEILARDTQFAMRIGINVTPTIFINNRRIEGTLPLPALRKIIETELAAGN